MEWSAKDDSLLLVGIWRHGFGSWEQIQADKELGLTGKFFLEVEKKDKENGTPVPESKDEKKERAKAKKLNSPGPVHLVRRGDYLLMMLRESDSATKMEKESTGPKGKKPRPSVPTQTSPAPVANGHSKPASKSSGLPAKPQSTKPTKKQESDSSSDEDSDASESDIDTAGCKELLRPVKRELKDLRDSKTLTVREEKLKVYSRCLLAIGKRVEEAAVEKGTSAADRERVKRHLWRLVCGFWPVESVPWSQLHAMCK